MVAPATKREATAVACACCKCKAGERCYTAGRKGEFNYSYLACSCCGVQCWNGDKSPVAVTGRVVLQPNPSTVSLQSSGDTGAPATDGLKQQYQQLGQAGRVPEQAGRVPEQGGDDLYGAQVYGDPVHYSALVHGDPEQGGADLYGALNDEQVVPCDGGTR